jgi:hypothetical protein
LVNELGGAGQIFKPLPSMMQENGEKQAREVFNFAGKFLNPKGT